MEILKNYVAYKESIFLEKSSKFRAVSNTKAPR